MAVVTLVGVTPLAAAGSPFQEQAPTAYSATSERRPLDPLTPEEQSIAERIALSDGKVKEMLRGTGTRVVSVVPVVLKHESPEKMDLSARQVEVILFQPQSEVGAQVFVDLRHNNVLEMHRLASQQVRMTVDDLNDAYQLAMRDPAVTKALGQTYQSFRPQYALTGAETAEGENVVSGLPLRSTEAKDPCSKHRCMELFFRRGTDYLSEPIVLVDLTARKVSVERSKSK